MAEYRLHTIWRLRAPVQPVYDAITDSLRWPEWWPGADQVVEIAPGEDSGIGNVRRYVWKGRLPYRICFDAYTTRIDHAQLLEATVTGDLAGTGRWVFVHDTGITTVRHEWNVRTTRRWMNLAAPVARVLFTSNHQRLMTQGAHGLARKLGVRHMKAIVERQEDPIFATAPVEHIGTFNSVAASLAGVAAGGIATVAQVLAWRIYGYPIWEMLLRDSRFAAAIVLGPSVLPPPIGLDWRIVLAAASVHILLSIVVGLVFASILARQRMLIGVTAGSLFGLALFALNMFGMTSLFPWFTASRDWATAFAHLVFGATIMPSYALMYGWMKEYERGGNAG